MFLAFVIFCLIFNYAFGGVHVVYRPQNMPADLKTAMSSIREFVDDNDEDGDENDDDNGDNEEEMKLPRKILAEILQKDHFFQDIFSEQLSPTKIQFGHVCENPNEWEQRFEENDYQGNRYQGKVLWGDKNGAHGEQYWDLNHGNAGERKEEEN